MKFKNIFLFASAALFTQQAYAQASCDGDFTHTVDTATKTATFTSRQTGVCTDYNYSFEHRWDFGDGQTQTQQQEPFGTATSHTYATTGTYLVQYQIIEITGVGPQGISYGRSGGESRNITIPIAVSLEESSNQTVAQTFPNPFHNQISIQYDLVQNSEVEIALFDAIGTKVATLQNGQQAAGRQLIEWNSQQLPSGIYFVRLAVDNKIKTIKVSKL